MTNPGTETAPTFAHPLARTRLRVETSEIADSGPLLPLLDPSAPLLWSRSGDGMAGIGEVLRLEFSGPNRVSDAASAWRELVGEASIVDQVGVPGTGLIAFGTFAFADDSAETSVLIVPRVVVGHRGNRSWVTLVHAEGEPAASVEVAQRAFGDEFRVRLVPGELPPAAYQDAVAQAVARIDAGELSKVVLARQIRGHVSPDADIRRVLDHLSRGYPDTWTFAVDGLVGSSPETLVRVADGAVSARVLAGTASRGVDAAADRGNAEALTHSEKDAEEHALAVRSAVDALEPHTSTLEASAEPFTVKLPNLWHLATDLEGTVDDGSGALDLVAAIHPTAAVAGTPREAAVRVLAELEGFDRGRYAAPVGWIGADGDGEWAIALRCAHVSPEGEITAWAGCGIVHDSDPAAELAETVMKFRPIVDAFG
ncbi:isochorismate synthase [Agromyces atrinae]|uniref:isochorismate synthase n=2 Tax=Agromyces atrinae TaxID=592376 RepID=A0A852SEU8_9MICO|nr:isochorismate synthase [Agromyces atrinae]NYD67350.1 menaquinone-specific isochorismate synthase [Agromyces atrinae]